MGRTRTIGFEAQALIASGLGNPYFEGSGGSGCTIDSIIKRSGNVSLKCNSGAGNAATASVLLEFSNSEFNLGNGATAYSRGYFYFDTLPSTTVRIMQFSSSISAGPSCSARVTSGGKLQLWKDTAAPAQIGSDSVATLTTGVWYRVEMSCGSVGTTTFFPALQLDGTAVASSASVSGNFNGNLGVAFGWVGAPGANVVCHVDDIAVNSNTGTIQNSFPGAGSVGLLTPVSDSARTGWLDGGGGTVNLFAAVDNEPPVGLATGGAVNGSQIRDIVSSTTDNYDTNCQDYLTAGIPSNAVITLVQAVCDEGQGTTAGSETGALQIVSNPAQSPEDSFTFAGNQATAVGTWPTGWEAFWGSAQYSPSVTLSAQPVLRVGKRTATTREVDVDFMGIEVEYTVLLGSALVPRLALLGVGH